MKTSLQVLTVNIILAAVVYGIFAFYEVKPYFGDWTSSSRAGAISVFLLIGFIVNIIFVTAITEIGGKK